jgi:penicillin amidase
VILNSRVGKAVYSVASSFRNRELSGIASLIDLYNAQTGAQINTAIARVPVTFNLFYATTRGEYGYRYAGLVPYRARGVDPRFPTPSGPNTEWQGFVSSNQMPHATSFRSGLIANWNNKPVSWWPNFDTPVWGTPFRNQALLDAIPSGKLGRFDLERAAWQIARRDTETMGIFSEHFRDAVRSLAADDPLRRYIENFDGWYVEGSVGALLYDSAVEHLRTELFRPSVGTFLQPTIFETVIQPGTIKKALERRTKFDYLGERRAGEVVLAALRKAFDSLKESQGDDPSKWTFRPGSINVRGQRPIPYINRGTYIQITELSPIPAARSVASPGVAESGAHQYDQADLARAWTYKPMWPLK